MAKPSTLTDQQIDQIHRLSSQGQSERQIALEMNISRAKVQTGLKRIPSPGQQKIASLISSPIAQATTQSVFDIVGQLEQCLKEIQELMYENGELKERVAVRTEKRMLIAEARATLESIYNIKLLNDFIDTVASILESEAPGSRKRIFDRLEQSVRGFAAIALFASGRNNPPGITE